MAQSQEEHCELVVVGAGLAALHLVSRLPEKLLQGTVVVDSSGGWLAAWSERCEQMEAQLLRTPVTQHPHAQPLALKTFAEKRGRLKELVPVVKGFSPVPSMALFKDFCGSKVVRALPAALRTPRHDAVMRLEPLEGAGGCRVHLASGAVLAARAVVCTPSSRCPVVPVWAHRLAGPAAPGKRLSDAGDAAAPEQGVAGAQDATTGTAGPRWQLPAGIATSDCVDLRSAELAGRTVLVLGGGMTAGLLAAGAAERGASVTLVCRRPLKPQPFETDVGWWGAKQLNGYRQVDDAATRHAACRRARRQGSVHLPLWRRLTQQVVEGRLTVLEGWEVVAAERQPSRRQVERPEGSALCAAGAGASWLVTLARYQPPRQEPPGGPTLFQQAVAATAGEPARRGGQARSDIAQQQAGQPGKQEVELEPPGKLSAQLVWLACGAAYDADGHPLLAPLLRRRPAPMVGGYVCLDDEHLCWPGAAVYLAGRGALLSLGPCAGDLPGMRLAADRIAASLQRLDYSDGPVWVAAQQRLLARMCLDPDGADGEAGGRLAAAVAAAAAALGPVPLEAYAVAYEDPVVRPSIAKAEHLIDVSDLDPTLPRKEVQQYKFTDDDFELCIICQLDEPIPQDQVRVRIGERSLEVWAVGAAAAHRLHVPRLYGGVIPSKCRVKVNQKARKLFLLLRKDCDAEWRFLKG